MTDTPMQRYWKRVQHFFAKNAQRTEPLKTAVYMLDSDLDVAGTAYCEFVVPRGTIAGERRALRTVGQRCLRYSTYAPLEFVGYESMKGYDPVCKVTRKNVVCAHFKLHADGYMKPRDIWVNKRFHEVFGSIATKYYLQRGGIVTYCTDDETAPALGSVCEYLPNIPAHTRKGGVEYD